MDPEVHTCDLDTDGVGLNEAGAFYREEFKGTSVLFLIDDFSALQEINIKPEMHMHIEVRLCAT